MSAAVVELLRAGRERIARGWARHYFAYDANGKGVLPWTPQATSWCAVGALRIDPCTSGSREYGEALRALRAALALSPAFGPQWDVSDFNDAGSTTQADLLAGFDRAIAAAEAAS